MGVNLSSTDVTVAEERLDRAKVGAIHKEVSGERMAESVWSNMLSNTSKTGIFFDNALNRASGEAAKIARSVWSV